MDWAVLGFTVAVSILTGLLFGLAVVLLVGAGLLGKSLLRATGVDAGLRRENVLTLSMSLPQARYDTGQKVDAFSQALLERVTSLPGVESAGLGTGLPMGARSTIMFSPEGRAPSNWGEPWRATRWSPATISARWAFRSSAGACSGRATSRGASRWS